MRAENNYTENRGYFWDYDYEPHEVPLSVLSFPISDEEFLEQNYYSI